MDQPEYLDVGEHALLVQFGSRIDPRINARVLSLDRALQAASLQGLVELVPTYRSLMIHYDPMQLSRSELALAVDRLLTSERHEAASVPGRRWSVPVCYGGEFGEDLAEIASRHGLDESAVAEVHAAATYRVYMIGFAPGFAYLGGLPEQLATPRRVEPRMWTPAGSVAIGGAQSSIASVAGPSGWHMIGRTPYRSFDPDREPVFLFQAGDEIRFIPITPEEWHNLAGRIERGEAARVPSGVAP